MTMWLAVAVLAMAGPEKAPPPPRVIDADPAPPARVTPDAEFRQKRPTAMPERPFKVPAVKRFRLDNGLRVILAESHKLPLVSLELVIKTGGAANPKGQAGLADLTANLLDEGTTSRNALAIADDMAFLGASLATGASWDATSVSVSSLAENIGKALEIWSDVVVHPAFDEKELERVRGNLLTALGRRKDSPPTVASLAFSRILFGDGHPYGWPASGTEDSLKALTIADVRKFYATYYTPGNAVLIAAGDITEAALKATVGPLLKSWKAKGGVAPALPKPVAVAKTKVFLIDKAGAPQSSIRIGLIGIPRKSPDYHKALVMNSILGGSFKRLYLNLREQKGWTYGVSSVFEARRTPGQWLCGGEFVAAHTAESVAEILREIRRLRDESVTDAELTEVKNEVTKAFPARFSTVNQLAAQMASLAVYDLPDNEFDSFTRKVSAVTKADVRKMAQKYLQPEKMVIVVVGDQKSNQADLGKLAELELRDLDGLPVK